MKNIDFQSIADYIEYESASETKHEYEKGEILMMSGGTINHGILCGNAYNELRKKVGNDKKKCSVIGSEVRIHIQSVNSIVYPDAMVICGEIEVSQEDEEAIINPLIVVEVLSKSTESYDRGDKFYKYRQLDSIKEYLLIDQEKPMVESFYKRENNIWEISRVSGLEKSLKVKSIGIEINLEDLYVNVKWKV
ncbi:MAG: Uma2 family endonuclease [Saprospiraceae bacterium]